MGRGGLPPNLSHELPTPLPRKGGWTIAICVSRTVPFYPMVLLLTLPTREEGGTWCPHVSQWERKQASLPTWFPDSLPATGLQADSSSPTPLVEFS